LLVGFAAGEFARLGFRTRFCFSFGCGGGICGGDFFAHARGKDFVGDFVAGAFERAPHVPTGDGAIGTPAFAKGEEFFGLGHSPLAVGDGPAFFYAEIVDGEDVGTAEIENQKHFDGPGADAADGDEAFDEFVVGELFGLLAGGDDSFESFRGEIFHGQDFCVRQAGFAEGGRFELQHFFGTGRAAVVAECFDAPENGGGGFAGDGLVSDGLHEGFVRRLGEVEIFLELFGGEDEFGEFFVLRRQMRHGVGEIEGQDLGGGGHDFVILAQVAALMGARRSLM